MLTFFRRIRKSLLSHGTARKYILYAAGEVLLVMVGILLALQVNNWNALQKLKEEEKQLFVKMMSDLQSDSILIVNALTLAKEHQNIHYQLYYQAKELAPPDTSLQYGLLRLIIPFGAIVKDNYQPIVDKIFNDKVRDSLNKYFQTEGRTRELLDQFSQIKVDFVRPYLTSNNIIDLEGVFLTPMYETPDGIARLKYEAIRKQFNTPEFFQILYELRVKTNGPIQLLERLLEENHNLHNIIQQVIELE